MGDLTGLGEGLGSGASVRVRDRFLLWSMGTIGLWFQLVSMFYVRVRVRLRFTILARYG